MRKFKKGDRVRLTLEEFLGRALRGEGYRYTKGVFCHYRRTDTFNVGVYWDDERYPDDGCLIYMQEDTLELSR